MRSLAWALISLAPAVLTGQGGNPRSSAPIDLTGYWVSVVTEDWAWRMVTPHKGDYASVPLNDEGRRVAGMWDPAKDEESGNQCRSYGVGHIMRVPGRLHVTWDNDSALKIETDAGQQTRLLRFDASRPPSGDAQWQGHSVATWEVRAGRGFGGRGGAAPRGGRLQGGARRAEGGYPRKNGGAHSENTRVAGVFYR